MAITGDTSQVVVEPPFFDVCETARVYGMNGREAAFYLIGRRSQYVETIPENAVPLHEEQAVTRLAARVSADHLAAITATLIRHGARIEMYSGGDHDGSYTLNID